MFLFIIILKDINTSHYLPLIYIFFSIYKKYNVTIISIIFINFNFERCFYIEEFKRTIKKNKMDISTVKANTSYFNSNSIYKLIFFINRSL